MTKKVKVLTHVSPKSNAGDYLTKDIVYKVRTSDQMGDKYFFNIFSNKGIEIMGVNYVDQRRKATCGHSKKGWKLLFTKM